MRSADAGSDPRAEELADDQGWERDYFSGSMRQLANRTRVNARLSFHIFFCAEDHIYRLAAFGGSTIQTLLPHGVVLFTVSVAFFSHVVALFTWRGSSNA